MAFRTKFLATTVVLFFGGVFPLPAQERGNEESDAPQVVVTTSKQEVSVDDVASSFTVITRKDIEAQGATHVSEVLRDVPGVSVTAIGSSGDDVDVRIRGADRDEVLVLIDGVSVNSVEQRRASLLGAISVDSIERIEVVRGSHSVLYGSDAIGGVINIISRKGVAGRPKFSTFFEAGNLQTFREGADVSGGTSKIRYSASASRTDQAGKFERDRYGETSVAGRFGYQFLPDWDLDVGINYIRADQDLFYEFQTGFDPVTFSLLANIDPDTDNHFHQDQIVSHVALKGTPRPWWQVEVVHGLLVDMEDFTNSDVNDAAPVGFAPNTTDFTGTGVQNTVDLRNFFLVHESDRFVAESTLGFEFQNESLSFTDIPAVAFPAPGQNGSRQNYAPYFQQVLKFFKDKLILTGGVRFDHNTTFGHEFSPAGSVVFKIPSSKTTFKANYGEGFHAPTVLEFFDQILLRELGDPAFQSVRLQPELSQSYDIGIEQEIGSQARISAAFFYVDYDRLFDGLQFINDAYTTGIEAQADWEPFSWLSMGANYTLLKGVNEDSGSRLADRPRHQMNFHVAMNPHERLQIRTDVRVTSSREVPAILSTSAGDLPIIFIDGNGVTSSGRNVSGHVKWDIAASYDVLPKSRFPESWKAYVKIENILNDSYQEKFGFPAPGVTFLAGTKVGF